VRHVGIEQLLQRALRLRCLRRLLRDEGFALLGLRLPKSARLSPRGMHIGELSALLERGSHAVSTRCGLQLLWRRRRVVDTEAAKPERLDEFCEPADRVSATD
jgi:hypothetical protein